VARTLQSLISLLKLGKGKKQAEKMEFENEQGHL
jgi:hypothetical protein